MLFGGLQKNSLIDYPGKISCALFVSGCNFKCPYCHNPGLVTGNENRVFSEEEVLSFLGKRVNLLDAVTVTGGEPTLHSDLGNFLGKVKQMGFLVKLDTNGSNPEKITEFKKKGLFDYIAMDIKTEPERYHEYVNAPKGIETALRESIRIIMALGNNYEFRTTCVKPFLSSEIIKKIGLIIKGAPLWAFQKCNPEKVLDPDFFKGKERLFSDKELDEFKKTALNFVGRSLVR